MLEASLFVNAVAAFFLAVPGYLFVVTRGTLLSRAFVPDASDKSHVYWVYSHMGLIRFVDRKPVISAILLFQYDRLVRRIVSEIKRSPIQGKTVLLTSCAFGDIIPKVVGASVEGGARRILITDIIRNELIHAEGKLGEFQGKFELAEADATCMKLGDGAVDINLVFFLFHELPDPAKQRALREAARVVAPGGKLIIAEFHRPRAWFMRLLGRVYFTVFEPFALAMWKRHDPVCFLERAGGWDTGRTTFCLGNFQIVVATKQSRMHGLIPEENTP